jgi:hypothetical protein
MSGSLMFRSGALCNVIAGNSCDTHGRVIQCSHVAVADLGMLNSGGLPWYLNCAVNYGVRVTVSVEKKR